MTSSFHSAAGLNGHLALCATREEIRDAVESYLAYAREIEIETTDMIRCFELVTNDTLLESDPLLVGQVAYRSNALKCRSRISVVVVGAWRYSD